MTYTIPEINGMLLKIAPADWNLESEDDLKNNARIIIEKLLDHAIYEEQRRGKILIELDRARARIKEAGLL